MVDRLLRISDGASRRWTYPVIAFVLALGSPAGLLLLRIFLEHRAPDVRWLANELSSHHEFYVYVTISTTIAFTVLGWLVGSMQERLRRLAISDPLTGIHNRRYFHTRMLAEVARAARYGAPLTVLVIDIDRLKELNDLRGHRAGDLALCAVARALASSARRTDFVARVGGDEFAVLAPATTAVDALMLAERIRANLRASSDTPTVSIGIADFEHAGDCSAESLYAAADAAAYEAKEGGRDRAVVAPKLGGNGAALEKHAALGRAPFGDLARAPTGQWSIAELQKH